MKLHIAICDDEATERAYLQQLTSNWIRTRNRPASVSAYDSAEAFLFAFSEDGSFDILLLDIQMKSMNGVSLARKLRETNDRLQIIFITGYADFIAEGYDVSALHYLMKPVDERKLYEVMDKACDRLSASARTILLPYGGGSLRLRADEILYAEVFSHHVELHTVSQTLRIKISLNDLVERLGDGFFRCHRSYIAGMEHVRKVTRTAMMLDNGVELPLSRKSYRDAYEEFIRHCRQE